MRFRKTWAVVCLFAAAMAWMEAATVIYLRTLVSRIQPYQPNPLPHWGSFEYVEIVREAATLLMLGTAAWLAGRDRRSRFAYFLVAFGLWDILYYAFLALTIGWPRSLADWDVLFLIPLPWWGPVVAPVLIALGMLICGTIITQHAHEPWPRRWAWVSAWFGAALVIGVFNADAAQAAGRGADAVRAVVPEHFRWAWFALALALMSAVLVDLLRQINQAQRRSQSVRTCASRGSHGLQRIQDEKENP